MRLSQGLRTLLKALAFFLRHRGLQDFDDAAAADDARQREGHTKPRLQTANWDHSVLIVEHHFGNTGRYDADAVLAGAHGLR